MYPNQQGFPGQYPPFGAGMPQPQQQPPFGSGYPPQQPPYGAGYPPQQPGFAQMPQPGFGQPPQPAPYGQQQPYGQMPQQPSYGQPLAGYPPAMPNAAPIQANSYPQAQATPSYPNPQHSAGYPQSQGMPNYTGSPQMQNQTCYQAQQMPSYGSPPATMQKGRPTITPSHNFNPSNDAAILRKAMKGFGTDEDALINVLCRRTSNERMQIFQAFKTAYGKDLIENIRSETSGNFERVLTSLLMPIPELYARELFEATSGVGTDEDVLIEVMCSMTNREIHEIRYMYQRLFGNSLESQLRGDTSGHMKRLLTSLTQGGRDESMMTDINSARMDAEALKRAGIDKFGTDESEFNRILCSRNYDQIMLVCQEYQKLTGNDLEKDIKREFSGDIEEALLAIVRVANNRPEFFARRLHKSMAGLGTNDNSLIRLCITRSEIDMVDVKEQFQRLYGKSLRSFIKGDTSGHYKHALYALCGENRSG